MVKLVFCVLFCFLGGCLLFGVCQCVVLLFVLAIFVVLFGVCVCLVLRVCFCFVCYYVVLGVFWCALFVSVLVCLCFVLFRLLWCVTIIKHGLNLVFAFCVVYGSCFYSLCCCLCL